MRIIATPAGVQPLSSTTEPADAANHERRGWLKRMGAMLGLGLLAGPALASTQGTRGVQRTTSSDPFIGEIMLFAGNFAPQGYALCNGQLLPISQYQALFSLLGTMYGGNGQTTFALPNLNGRAPIGTGLLPGNTNPYQVGQVGGSESVTLTTAQLPAHSHTLNVSSAVGTAATPVGNVPAATALASNEESVNAYATAANSTAAVGAIGSVGGSQPVSVLSPYLAMTYVIAINGVFPSRP